MKHTLINTLKKLNPNRSLFGKLFLWFWLATIVLIISAFWLSKQLSNDAQVRPITTAQQQLLEDVREKVHQMDGKRKRFKEQGKLAFYLHRKFNKAIVIHDLKSHRWYSDLPGAHVRGQYRFDEILKYNNPVAFNLGRFAFSGPIKAQYQQKEILIFVGQYRKGSTLHYLKESHPILFVSAILIISSLLCFFMAWRLNKPIRQLQKTVRVMATGDLSVRVKDAHLRHDELGQLSKDINHMAEQVENLITGQKRLLADISHELRSPLARLQIAIGIAQQQPDSELDNSTLLRIEKEADEIEAMITQVLALSRIEANAQSFNFDTINISSLINQITQDAQFEAQAQQKILSLTISPNIVMEGDGQLLSRAFENLIRNAIKYAKSQVNVCLEKQEEIITFSVADDGDGVDQNEIDKIFTPFYRTSNSRNRQSGGIGLGLAITRSAIALHQGKVIASNIKPNGLKVEVTL